MFFQIGQTNIKCDDSVTLLGINIDYMLKFDAHVSEICKKASKQLAVLKRLGGFLTRFQDQDLFILVNKGHRPKIHHIVFQQKYK